MLRWALVARILRRKVAFASVGVEAIRHPLTRLFIGAALHLSAFRSYRDEQSRARLRRIGFKVEQDEVYPDLAFSLAPSPPSPSVPGRPPVVAVGIYDYRGRGVGGPSDAAAYRAYVEKMGAFVLWLLGTGNDVRVVIGDVPYDEPVLADLRAWLVEHGVSRYGEHLRDHPAQSEEELLGQLAEAELVVASRFHNLVLAFLLGKPAISISYDPKNEALMGEMGLGSYCQTLDDLDLGRLQSQTCELRSASVAAAAQIARVIQSYRAQLEQQCQRLLRLGT